MPPTVLIDTDPPRVLPALAVAVIAALLVLWIGGCLLAMFS